MDKETAKKILDECCRENMEASVRQFMLDLLMTGSAVTPSGEVVRLFPEKYEFSGDNEETLKAFRVLSDRRKALEDAQRRGVPISSGPNFTVGCTLGEVR